MGKQILTTLWWTIVSFILIAAFKYFTCVDGWLIETLNLVSPLTIGYFLGYNQARSDDNR